VSAESRVLVIGAAGYVGRAVVSTLASAGHVVTGTSRSPNRSDAVVTDGVELDRLLDAADFAQVVVTAQLTSDNCDWILERIDGPRWLVISSAQVTAGVAAPGTAEALVREQRAVYAGATVLRPTMVFGRGGDVNISRIVRFLHRWRISVQIGDGRQLVQPIHVDDLAALIARHGQSPRSGLFAAGGREAVSMASLVDMLRSLVGVRTPPLRIPSSWLRQVARLPLPGLRPDQVLRLEEDKTVDNAPTTDAFNWEPGALIDRLGQAVREAIGQTAPSSTLSRS
jgi:nucleoside-diphosphate-sugar epimerase